MYIYIYINSRYSRYSRYIIVDIYSRYVQLFMYVQYVCQSLTVEIVFQLLVKMDCYVKVENSTSGKDVDHF